MSKRRIERALRKKGLSCNTLQYDWELSPSGSMAGWTIELDHASEAKVFKADPDFDNYEPDCWNTEDALDWVETLPDCSEVRVR